MKYWYHNIDILMWAGLAKAL